MSHLIAENYTDLRVDFLSTDGKSGDTILLGSPASFNTDITATSSSITLYSGSSYYLESAIYASSGNKNGAVVWQLYSNTDSSYIGQSAHSNVATNFGAAPRVGRYACSALVLDSDINVSKTISVRVVSLTGTGWSFDPASVPWYINHIGWPTLRVMQLPS